MREGWLLSDGEVIASAIELTSVLASVHPARAERPEGEAVVLRPKVIVLTTKLAEPASLVEVGSEGVVTGVRALRSWRVATVPLSTKMAAVVPTSAVERAGLEAGRSLEFREAR
jgi:hypothetical protein